MLLPFSNKKNNSKASKAETLLKKGFLLIKGKLYKQALIELKTALEQDHDLATKALKKNFTEYYTSFEYEASLSVGLVLLKSDPKNYELSNKVGNCARRLHNYKQANNLYKQALRANKNYAVAFLNLAASMGKVDRFNIEVKRLIEPFLTYKNFILPEYRGNEQVVNKMMASWEAQPKELRDDQSDLHEKIYIELKSAIKDSIKNGDSISEKSALKQESMFNLGLFALHLGDYQQARENFINLNKLKCPFEYLHMLLAISYYLGGEKSKALEIFTELLGKDPSDRYLNINLGILYAKEKNRLLSYKYFSISGILLEKSNGHFSRSEILRQADQCFESGDYKKALPLYQLVVNEVPDLHAMDRMGQIHMKKDSYTDAIPVYQNILKLFPDSELAKKKLVDIHDHFFEKGDALYKDQKIAQSAVLYERALSVHRPAETLQKLSRVYGRLRQTEKANALKEEYDAIYQEEEDKKQARAHEEYVIKGKAYMKAKDFSKSIENFEAAFAIKKDKDVFVFLAHLYKGLKMQKATNSLVQRWKQKLDHDERVKRLENKKKNEIEQDED